MSKEKIYITTPIYYVNDAPHLGHAYTSIACDIVARFYRIFDIKATFLTGTDEHGQKIEKAAKESGIDTQDFVDKISKNFENLSSTLQLSNTDFIRTTEQRHKKAVTHFWNLLESKGYIYLDTYSGWYAVRDEAFYTEEELIDGKAPTGAPLEWVTEESYFFKLSSFEQSLLDFYDAHPEFIQPMTRRNEVISFVRSGLRDLCISRTSFRWGISVPSNPKHVIYVWLDALVNYITAIGYPDHFDDVLWRSSIHIVGKDILLFHAVYWPAFLMAANLAPPKKIFAHGWWTHEGEKMSKSLGNAINPIDLVKNYGLDALRYFLFREMTFGQDGDFSKQGFINRLNNDLANKLGNLCQRVLSFINRYESGCLKVPTKEDMASVFLAVDTELLDQSIAAFQESKKNIEQLALNKYIEILWGVIDRSNQYVDDQKPWQLRSHDPKRLQIVLYVLCIVLRNIAILLQPLLPDTANKILDMLCIPKDKRMVKDLQWQWEEGTVLPEPAPLFTKVLSNS